jgi:hypothetical protein
MKVSHAFFIPLRQPDSLKPFLSRCYNYHKVDDYPHYYAPENTTRLRFFRRFIFMKSKSAVKLLLVLLLCIMLFSLAGCESLVRGGTEIVLEGVSMGTLSMEGKPVQGLPAGKIDLVIKVPTNRVTITSTEDEMIVRLSPSDALITKGPDGLSITGVEPDEIEMRWQASE